MARKPVNIAVAGALGRMGRAVLKACLEDPRVRVSGAWERTGHPQLGQDAGTAAGLPALGLPLLGSAGQAMRGADAVVDFSVPEATLQTLKAAGLAKPRPVLVVGTTGFDRAGLRAVQAASRKAPLVHSSNFSVGVNILWKLCEQAAKVTGDDYDVEIVDLHHHHKKDAPSGTAVTTAQVLAKALGRDLGKVAVYGRHGVKGSRPSSEIGIHALRAGDVVGDHTVYFCGPAERLELTHRAHARENFARGALRAALWLAAGKKRSGSYSMAQVLGLDKVTA